MGGAGGPGPLSPRGRLLLGAVGLAVIVVATWRPAISLATATNTRASLWAAGRVLGMAAGTLVMLQFALSARIKLLDRAFGLDRLLRFHKLLGVSAGVAASLHPLLVYGSGFYSTSDLTWSRWPELLGAALLAVLWVILCTSLWSRFLGLSYRGWWGIHQLVFLAAAMAVTHGLAVGSDLAGGWLRAAWMAIAACYAGLFVWVKLVKPFVLRARRFAVASVERLNYNVCEVELTAPPGRAFRHLPGQFAFLKLHGRGLPAEEHPFTISSPPSPDGRRARFTIKASGDFTARICEFRAGDWATVDGPYGLFSHLARAAGDGPLVMIAGGIGITPILSMIEHMAAAGDKRPVTLIWGNRREEDILRRREVEALAAGPMNLRIHHVLSAQEDWDGPKGYVDAAALKRLLGEEELAAHVFLCGPPVMMDSVGRSLRSLKVPRRRIHTERFAL